MSDGVILGGLALLWMLALAVFVIVNISDDDDTNNFGGFC